MTGLILCGGEGKRLQGLIPSGMPKCLLQIGGRPVWQYALMAAEAGGCRQVHLAPGPFAGHFKGYGHWLVTETAREGTVAVVRRCLAPAGTGAVAVFNGDTVLFGDFEIPTASGLTLVLGRNRVTGRSGEPVFRVVGSAAALGVPGRDLEDLKPGIVVDLSSSLAFIDIGTPQGLAHALAEANKWS